MEDLRATLLVSTFRPWPPAEMVPALILNSADLPVQVHRLQHETNHAAPFPDATEGLLQSRMFAPNRDSKNHPPPCQLLPVLRHCMLNPGPVGLSED
jgi:hypothetical protein